MNSDNRVMNSDNHTAAMPHMLDIAHCESQIPGVRLGWAGRWYHGLRGDGFI